MNLLLDIGNSHIKVGYMEDNQLVEDYRMDPGDSGRIKRILYDTKFSAAILAASGKLPGDVLDALYREVKYVLELNHLTKIPIQNQYETPDTLGKDRLAAAIGGDVLYPGENLLILDFGTALTYEYVDNHSYLGGNISPGLSMRFAALHQMTDKLPHLSQAPFSSPGKNTKQAILAGVIQGIIYESEQYMAAFLDQHPSGKIILTGGDSNFFAEKIKYPIFVHPDLVFQGLNRILEYNR